MEGVKIIELTKELILREPLLREAPGGGFDHIDELFPFVGGGSDRIFCRIRQGDRSLVFLYDENKENLISFLKIGKFFQENSIPVPRIYAYDLSAQKALLEDLEDESHFSKVRSCHDLNLLCQYYQKVIDILVTMQGILPELIAGCPTIQNKIFNYEQLRWETNYFSQYFLGEYCRLPMENNKELLEEGFHHLAASFTHEPVFLMHRDFQSQNIIWKSGQPYLIDFQGARLGPSSYDPASFLHDCYIILEDELRQFLISYYLKQRQQRWGISQGEEDFKDLYLRSALQRNMQALGAFSFLSLIKEKKHFEQFIPTGLFYLKSHLKHYPPLANLDKKIQEIRI